MAKLLLIMGDVAAGKSSFSSILSKRYDVNVFTKDSIKEILGDTIGFSNREENLKLSAATMELMLFIFTEFTKRNKNLILEANFHKAELEQFHEIAARNHYDVLTLELRGDLDILHERYLNRIVNQNRHPVHLSTTLDVYEDFKGCMEAARAEGTVGDVLRINANDFSYQEDEALLGKIDGFMRI